MNHFLTLTTKMEGFWLEGQSLVFSFFSGVLPLNLLRLFSVVFVFTLTDSIRKYRRNVLYEK